MTNAVQTVSSELISLPLPDGWSVDSIHDGRWVVIYCPAAVCTIDIAGRCVRAGGNVTHGAPLKIGIGRTAFSGRGWVKKLHDAAVTWLMERVAEDKKQ